MNLVLYAVDIDKPFSVPGESAVEARLSAVLDRQDSVAPYHSFYVTVSKVIVETVDMVGEEATRILAATARTVAEYVGFIVANVDTGRLKCFENLVEHVKDELIILLILRTCVIRKSVTRDLGELGVIIEKIIGV